MARKIVIPDSIFDGDGCGMVVCCMPLQGWRMIMALSRVFMWRIYESPSGQFSYPVGEKREIVQETMKGLVNYMCLDDLLMEIKEISNKGGNMCGCCCGCRCGCGGSGELGSEESFTNPPVDEIVTPPSDNWKCGASHQYYDSWVRFLDELIEETSAGNTLANAIVEAIEEGGIFNFVGWVVTTLVNAFVGWVLSPIANTAKTALQANASDFVCALYCSSSPGQAKSRIFTLIDSWALDWRATLLLKGMGHLGDWNYLFIDGSLELDPGNVTADCSSCSCGGQSIDPGDLPVDPPEQSEHYFFRAGIGTDATQYPSTEGSNVVYNAVYGRRSVEVTSSVGTAERSRVNFGTYGRSLAGLRCHLVDLAGYATPPAGFDGLYAIDHEGNQSVLDPALLPIDVTGVSRIHCNSAEGSPVTMYFWCDEVGI